MGTAIIAAGTALRAEASAVVGGMGLAVAPVAAAGAVLGVAGYGLFKLFEGHDNSNKKDERK
jgi:hypothetical protein